MNTQTSVDQRNKTTALQRYLFSGRSRLQKLSMDGMRKALRRIGRRSPMFVLTGGATEEQTHLLLSGMTLSIISIIAAILPLCGLPIAILSLFIGLYGYNLTRLRTLSAWIVVLSLCGLLLSLVCTILMFSIYFSSYWLP